jgi:hypothetical protein
MSQQLSTEVKKVEITDITKKTDDWDISDDEYVDVSKTSNPPGNSLSNQTKLSQETSLLNSEKVTDSILLQFDPLSTEVKKETLQYSHNCKYIGTVKDGKKHGFGILTFPDKSTYEGQFENDLLHGIGTLTTSNYSYKGEFKNNKRDGPGVYTTKSFIYNLVFSEDIMNLYCECTGIENKIKYKGNLGSDANPDNNSKMWFQGKCIMSFEDCVYTGNVVSGIPKGDGVVKKGNVTFTGKVFLTYMEMEKLKLPTIGSLPGIYEFPCGAQIEVQKTKEAGEEYVDYVPKISERNEQLYPGYPSWVISEKTIDYYPVVKKKEGKITTKIIITYSDGTQMYTFNTFDDLIRNGVFNLNGKDEIYENDYVLQVVPVDKNMPTYPGMKNNNNTIKVYKSDTYTKYFEKYRDMFY